MFYVLLRVLVTLICVFVKFDQTVHLTPMHFTMCKLYLNFFKKVKKLYLERFTELPNITKLEIKLKDFLFAASVGTSKECEPDKQDTSLCFLECLLSGSVK